MISRLRDARDNLAEYGSVFDLASAGHAARIDWEHRAFMPVELAPTRRTLAHGRLGGWITAVLRDDDGMRLLGMCPRQ